MGEILFTPSGHTAEQSLGEILVKQSGHTVNCGLLIRHEKRWDRDQDVGRVGWEDYPLLAVFRPVGPEVAKFQHLG